MKPILAFTILSIFIINKSILYAQKADARLNLPEDEQLTDTLTLQDFFEEDQSFIDEDPNEIFSEKMDSLVNTWHIKNSFVPDSIELTRIKNFPKNLPDSVYIQRLQETEQVIDLSYNNTVKNYIKLYTENKRELSELIIGLSYYYFPLFEETFDRYNMPLELKYLAIIESALNPKALSRAGANGLWQFMYGTAKNMKLEITSFVDERRDPVKSTDAAARYLKNLYDTYGDWHLAIAAYNCGPGNVNRAIRRSGGKRNYWDIYYHLPRETRGYVPAFIAANYFANYYKEHNLIPRLPDISMETDTLMISDYLHFDQLSAVLDISKEELRSLNPMYRRDVIPAKKNKPYPVVLPVNKTLDFIDNETLVFDFEREKHFPNNTLQSPNESSGYFTPVDIEGKAQISYTVKSGDNVGYISSWFNIRASDLRYWNNINRNLIRIGQKLVIYIPEDQKDKYERVNTMTFAQKQEMIGKSVNTTNKEEKNPVDPNYEYYTVKSGDTLWDIAQKYAGISSTEIMELNQLKNDRNLFVGQKLKIKRKI